MSFIKIIRFTHRHRCAPTKGFDARRNGDFQKCRPDCDSETPRYWKLGAERDILQRLWRRA